MVQGKTFQGRLNEEDSERLEGGEDVDSSGKSDLPFNKTQVMGSIGARPFEETLTGAPIKSTPKTQPLPRITADPRDSVGIPVQSFSAQVKDVLSDGPGPFEGAEDLLGGIDPNATSLGFQLDQEAIKNNFGQKPPTSPREAILPAFEVSGPHETTAPTSTTKVPVTTQEESGPIELTTAQIIPEPLTPDQEEAFQERMNGLLKSIDTISTERDRGKEEIERLKQKISASNNVQTEANINLAIAEAKVEKLTVLLNKAFEDITFIEEKLAEANQKVRDASKNNDELRRSKDALERRLVISQNAIAAPPSIWDRVKALFSK
jgi:hypothetical protein